MTMQPRTGEILGQVGRLDDLLIPLGIIFLARGVIAFFGALAIKNTPCGFCIAEF